MSYCLFFISFYLDRLLIMVSIITSTFHYHLLTLANLKSHSDKSIPFPSLSSLWAYGFISLSSAPRKEKYIWQLQEWCIPTVTSLSITFLNNFLSLLKKSLPFWSHPHLENGLYPASCCIFHESPLIYPLINHLCLFPVVHLHLLSPSSWTIASPISIVSGLYSSLKRKST